MVDLGELNPWKKISFEWESKTPLEYILPGDWIKPGKFCVKIPPDPFIGDFSGADVFLLMLNPGLAAYKDIQNSAEEEFFHMYPEALKDVMKNLRQEKTDYPFYWLNPKYMLSPGFRYWYGKLKRILYNGNYLGVSKRICIVQFYPYHSKSKPSKSVNLKSQTFGEEIVKNAIANDKIVVIMRSEGEWDHKITELKDYRYTIISDCQRNPALQGKTIKKINEFLKEQNKPEFEWKEKI